MRLLFIFLWMGMVSAETIMTIDALADVYYDEESGDAIASDEIKALNGKEIRLAGYMVPFNDLENLKEFMLMPASNGCNFCESPIKEEMIYVRQPGKKKYQYSGDPLLITGKLWVQGAGTPPPNKTYAQFLYALQDAKVETLKPEHHDLLTVVTPRTIVKQVCSLLRVKLLQQVEFLPLEKAEMVEKRKELVSKYLGGAEGAENLMRLLSAFNHPRSDELLKMTTEYVAGWTAAFSSPTGDKIYYLEGMDLSVPENQHQIAIACYDLLFAQEAGLHEEIHKGSPSYDELYARLSLILGLRQSFAQFYGSIGKIDLEPMEGFATPYSATALPSPYGDLSFDLLVGTQKFIEAIYKTERYQPYTKAIEAPPVSTVQILDHTLYTESEVTFTAPQAEGFSNRLGPYLASKLTGIPVETLSLKADGLKFSAETFLWQLEFPSEEKAEEITETLQKFPKVSIKREKNTLSVILRKD